MKALWIFLSLAFLIFASSVSAQSHLISSTGDYLFIGGNRRLACYANDSTSQLGVLNSTRLQIGARFSSIDPVQEAARHKKNLRAFQKTLSSTRRKASQAKLRAKIRDAKAALRALELATAACHQFTNSRRDNPPGDVNPAPPEEEEPAPPVETFPSVLSNVRFTGAVSVPGLVGELQAVLSGPGDVFTAPVRGDRFQFSNIPSGEYLLSIHSPGLNFGFPKRITVGNLPPFEGLSVRFTASDVLAGSKFLYHWEAINAASSGYEYSAKVVDPPRITFRDEEIVPADTSASNRLFDQYKVILSNEGLPWDIESADRLYKIFETLPVYRDNLPISKWVLTDDELPNDMVIEGDSHEQVVRLSRAPFTNATPRLVEIDGTLARYFSKRLHKAIVRFVTNNGTDIAAVQKILVERFAVSLHVPSYEELTRTTTLETYTSFMDFKPEERIALINMFEEMPEGLHKVAGLNYLVRRRDGYDHPFSPEAAAIAWVGVGYIEFMEKAFLGEQLDGTHRLILHEKAHFLWHNVFDDTLRNDWIALGEWFKDENGRWQTHQTTQFVSAYAHLKNPDEDMAESIAIYILKPEVIQARAPQKYEFLRDRVMKGSRYLSRIREDLTFRVYNLSPDYIYPGKIRRLDINVDGAPHEDKKVRVEIELFAGNRFEGATFAYARVMSPDGKSFHDVGLAPVNADKDGIGTILRGEFTVSRLSQRGFWNTYQISLFDQVQNVRYQGSTTFGWKLFINNPLQDRIAPKYVPGSMRLAREVRSILGQPVEAFIATWQVEENRMMRSFAPTLARLTNRFAPQGSLTQWGTFDAASRTARVEFLLNPHRPSGDYALVQADMIDEALNTSMKQFFDPAGEGQEEAQRLTFSSAAPDTTPVEISLNDISISAVPTHPEAPNGETRVALSFFGRDDLSGIHALSVYLRDPNGNRHHVYVNHRNSHSVVYDGDPTAWERFEKNILLPVGSIPGVWGLGEIYTRDLAGNERTYSFVETVHFQVQE